MNSAIMFLAGEVSATGMEAIIAGVTIIITMVGQVFTAIVSNAYLATIAGAGLLTIGISVFRNLRGASGG